jgi:hypothetical protein
MFRLAATFKSLNESSRLRFTGVAHYITLSYEGADEEKLGLLQKYLAQLRSWQQDVYVQCPSKLWPLNLQFPVNLRSTSVPGHAGSCQCREEFLKN